jgi:hypothetical protein
MILRSALAAAAVLSPAPAAVAQDFAFSQRCTLVLEACDMNRDGSEFCPTGREVAVDFWAEGEAFYIRPTGGTDTGFGAKAEIINLGQGYFDESLRVYYLLGQKEVDGVFWISVPGGASGAQLNRGGQEDYFGGTCRPLE